MFTFIQHNTYQNTRWLLSNQQADPTIHVEIQGTKKNQNDIEKEQCWKTHTS